VTENQEKPERIAVLNANVWFCSFHWFQCSLLQIQIHYSQANHITDSKSHTAKAISSSMLLNVHHFKTWYKQKRKT
jgi:hypothetical protein